MKRIGTRGLMLAAMLASLTLSVGLVVRFSVALTPQAIETRSYVEGIALLDLSTDLGDLALFDNTPLSPGVAEERCVRLRSKGSKVPELVELRMFAASEVVAFADAVQVLVDRGQSDGADGACSNFVLEDRLYDGTLTDTITLHAEGAEPWRWAPSADTDPELVATAYRVTMVLSPDVTDELQGAQASLDLAWETTYESIGRTVTERSVALLVQVSEDSLIPLLAMIAVGILFLSIQSRLDASAGQLGSAALVSDVVTFQPPPTRPTSAAATQPRAAQAADSSGAG